MVATYTKHLLSESVNGRQIMVTGTATPGTLIHTAVSGSTDFDEIYLFAVNPTVALVKLTLLWGGTSDPADTIEVNIPAESGYYLVIPGLLLQNSLQIKGYVGVAGNVLISGFVNRISG